MPRKPRADDDEDINVCLGTGMIGDLRDGPPPGRHLRRAIGFVHFPERGEQKPKRTRAAKPVKQNRPKK